MGGMWLKEKEYIRNGRNSYEGGSEGSALLTLPQEDAHDHSLKPSLTINAKAFPSATNPPFFLAGTLDNPIVVNSAGDEQLAGCTGYPADSHVVHWLGVRPLPFSIKPTH